MPANRVQKLQSRRTDPSVSTSKVYEVYDRIAEDEAIKYAVGAMQPIDLTYTTNTYAEGERIKSQLDKALNDRYPIVEFEYQGSVTNDTHIKAYSDIDILALHCNFCIIEPPARPTSLYQGDIYSDLRSLRLSCANHLKSAFPAVNVDDRPGKCIALSGGSLKREIDLVISNWWNTTEYQKSPAKIYRGVEIFDSKTELRIQNKPFLHNALIDARDKSVGGNLRKVVRLLKSLKYDADKPVEISSYDIASIAYNMPESFLTAQRGSELILVENARFYLAFLLNNDEYRNAKMVPNGMRAIFAETGASVGGLRKLHDEVDSLAQDITMGLSRSFRKLADARVNY